MDTYIYLRTSTEEQNPEQQLEDCKMLLGEKETFKVLIESQSAFKDDHKREEFIKLKQLIKASKVKKLIVWDLDRIYRNRIKLREFLILSNFNQVTIYSYRQKWMNDLNKIPSPWDEIVYDLMINILGYLAEEESLKKSERVKKAFTVRGGVTVAKISGKRVGRKKLPKQTKDRIIDLHNKGKSIREIAKLILTTDKNNNSQKISKSVVHKTIVEYRLENPSNLGLSIGDPLKDKKQEVKKSE